MGNSFLTMKNVLLSLIPNRWKKTVWLRPENALIRWNINKTKLVWYFAFRLQVVEWWAYDEFQRVLAQTYIDSWRHKVELWFKNKTNDFRKFTFMLENYPAHSAKKTNEYLNKTSLPDWFVHWMKRFILVDSILSAMINLWNTSVCFAVCLYEEIQLTKLINERFLKLVSHLWFFFNNFVVITITMFTSFCSKRLSL